MRVRLRDRLSSIISVFLLLALAGGSYYLAEKSSQFEDKNRKPLAQTEPDSFVDGLNLTKVNARGEPVFRLQATRMVHFPADNHTEFVLPVVVSLDTDKPRVTVRAKKARSDGNGDVTELFDDVELLREAGGTDPQVRVTTQAMVLFSQEEIARSDREVKIEYASSVLTGVGMEFNHATRQLSLNGAVKGSFSPQKKNANPITK
jgi:lipopolysaccharide export system protein LptC